MKAIQDQYNETERELEEKQRQQVSTHCIGSEDPLPHVHFVILVLLPQSQVLESMQLEFATNKEELNNLQKDLDQQVQGVQERRDTLQDQKVDLMAEEERLVQLRSANSKETEEVLRRQSSELKDAIEKEKAELKSLQEYVWAVRC